MKTRECLRKGPEFSGAAAQTRDLSPARSRAIIRSFRGLGSPEQKRAALTRLYADWKKVREGLDERGLRSRRDLDDCDIIGVLKNLPEINGAQVDVQKLKHMINYAVGVANLLSLASPSPQDDRRSRHGGSFADTLLRTLTNAIDQMGGWGTLSLASELDEQLGRRRTEAATVEEWTAAIPDNIELLADVLHRSGISLPTNESLAQIAQTRDELKLFAELASKMKSDEGVKEKRQRRCQRAPDFSRYVLISALVTAYELAFELRANVTRGGPCCRFLASVISRCEEAEISLDTTYASWLKARGWKRPHRGLDHRSRFRVKKFPNR